MTETITLNTPNDLVSFFEPQRFRQELLAHVQLGEAFNLHFKICGSQWSGKFDYRVGRFIFELQRDLFSLYQEATGEKISYRNRHETIEKILVTAIIQDGSLDFLVEMKDAIQEMVKKMSGKQIVYGGLIALLLWCGRDAYISWNERQMKAAEIAAQLQINQGRDEAVRQAIEILGRSSVAAANLFGRMEQEDTVAFRDHSGTIRTLEAREIKANLPERITEDIGERMISQQVWGRFQIIRQDNERFTFTLAANGVPNIKAMPSFSTEAARAEFFQRCQEQMNRSETPTMTLQLSILVNGDKVIQNALILEVLPADPSDIESIHDFLATL